MQVQLSEAYQKDVHRAIEILKEAGCTHVFLFGSLTAERMGDRSDIDLAIRGCPKGKFFHLLGKLLLELDHPVDLVNLDRQDAFARYLEEEIVHLLEGRHPAGEDSPGGLSRRVGFPPRRHRNSGKGGRVLQPAVTRAG